MPKVVECGREYPLKGESESAPAIIGRNRPERDSLQRRRQNNQREPDE